MLSSRSEAPDWTFAVQGDSPVGERQGGRYHSKPTGQISVVDHLVCHCIVAWDTQLDDTAAAWLGRGVTCQL